MRGGPGSFPARFRLGTQRRLMRPYAQCLLPAFARVGLAERASIWAVCVHRLLARWVGHETVGERVRRACVGGSHLPLSRSMTSSLTRPGAQVQGAARFVVAQPWGAGGQRHAGRGSGQGKGEHEAAQHGDSPEGARKARWGMPACERSRLRNGVCRVRQLNWGPQHSASTAPA